MSLVVSAPEGGSAWELLEAGTYPAVCFGIVDIGEQENSLYEKTQRQVIIMWELPGETQEFDGVLDTRVISETYTASLGEKANLRKMLDGWRGRPFNEEELKGFDLRNILGVPCLLGTIVKESSKGKQFAKISTVSKMPKGYPALDGKKDKLIYDLDAPHALDEMDKLPEWIQNRIKESITYKGMTAFTDMGDIDEDLPFA